MQIIPAIDLLNGNCVRLTKGDKNKCTVYSNDPISIIKEFKKQGAELVHVVDLNGAFEGKMKNLNIIQQLAKEVQIEVGGGIRSKEQIEKLNALGINRIIASTNLEELKQYNVIPGLDFKNGKLAINGWTQTTEVNLNDILERVNEVIVTDVSVDGTLCGPNLQLMKQIQNYGVKVIASGGISSIKNIITLKEIGVKGVIIGKALYEKKFNLQEAIKSVN